jgi:hypothetical protein
MTNPRYAGVARAQVAAGDARFPALPIEPANLNPAMYINPLLGGQVFFNKLEVTLDGARIEGPNFEGNDAYIYQILNRVYCTDGARKEKYGENFQWISTSSEMRHNAAAAAIEGRPAFPLFRTQQTVNGLAANLQPPWDAAQNAVAYVPAVPLFRHSSLVRVMSSLTYDALDDAGHFEPNVLRFGFDGYFPISCQNNALRALNKGHKVENKWLHPETEFCFVLHKREPLHGAFERADVTDVQYFGGEGAAGAAPAVPALVCPGFTVAIESVTLTYEVVTLEKDALDLAKKGPETYLCDVPQMRQRHLEPNVLLGTPRFILPARTRFIYLVFLHESQINAGARPNSFLTGRLRYPHHLDTVKIDLPGREGLIFGDGLDGLGTKMARSSMKNREYVADLVRRGLYSKSFDTLFPPTRDNNYSLDQALVYDMTPFDLKEPQEMTVTLTYSLASKEGWYLRLYALVQRSYEYSERDRWVWKEV